VCSRVLTAEEPHPSDFDGFLRALKDCDVPPKNLVADDSVNRYMANPSLRASAPSNVPLVYVSKAAMATCDALQAATEENRRSFLASVRADQLLDPPRCRPETNEPVGERVGLAYDAADLMVKAVESIAAQLRYRNSQPWDPSAIRPITVYIEAQRLAEHGFHGVTGLIQFRRDSGIPNGRRLSLMRVEHITDTGTAPKQVYWCETSTPDVAPPSSDKDMLNSECWPPSQRRK